MPTPKPKPAPQPATSEPLIPPSVLFVAVLIFTTALLYWPALQNGFVNFDDTRYVTENPHVQTGLTLDNIRRAFTQPVADNWHPLTVLSYMAVCQFAGLSPWAHHFVSVLFHTVNAALVFILLRQLTGSLWKSFFVAALFAVHPLRVESVAWVAERKDVLSGFFGLLTLIFYARYARAQTVANRSAGRRPGALEADHLKRAVPEAGASHSPCHFSRAYWLALVCFALGLMCKPMLVTWPFVLLLLDYWPLNRISHDETMPPRKPPVAKLLLEKIPFLLLALAACIVTFLVQQQGSAVETVQNLPLAARFENALVSYARYLEKTFWPADLAVLYPHPGHWPISLVLLAAAILAAITVLVIALRRQPALLIGWLWFVGTLIPVIGLVQVGSQSMADRYTYLPSIGLLILIVWGADALASRQPVRMAALVAAGGAAIIACIAVTRQQLPFWRDSETLFRHAAAVTKSNSIAHYNLGTALDTAGHPDQAMMEYRAVLEIQPTNSLALLNLAGDYYQEGDMDQATIFYRQVLQLQPNNDKAHNDLGIIFLRQGQTDDAIKEFREALRVAPENPSAHNSLGAAFFTQGQIDAAIPEFEQALRLKPDYAEVHYNLGCICAQRGQTNEAIGHFQSAIRLNPSYTEARDQLAKLQQSQP